MNFDKESIYASCPPRLQTLLCSLEGWRINRRRYSSAYRAVFDQVLASAELQAETLKAYQGRRLRNHLMAAADTIFWSKRFAEAAINPTAEDPWAEIRKLPILTKGEVQESKAEITNPAYGVRNTTLSHTSGTTGAGLVFPVTNRATHEQWATWWRYRQWHGLREDTWCGYFGGRSIAPVNQKNPPYWRTNYPGRQIMFSAYHLNERTARHYLKALVEKRITWLHGYPSVLSLLASIAMDQGLNINGSISLITIGAESLQAHQRTLIEKAFGCQVRQHYGMAEGVANISERQNGQLCVDEDYAFVEFVYDKAADAHRIIGTNWSNPAFPLFRYDTSDFADLPSDAMFFSPGWRIVTAIDGRHEDYITLPDGTKLGRLDHILKDFVEIREAQIFQKNLDEIEFRVVKGSHYDATSEKRLIHETRKRIGESMTIRVQYVPAIERSARGKIKFVVSNV